MRVLFIVKSPPDSGISSYGMFLAEKLREKGIEVDIDKAKHRQYDLIHVHGAYPQDFFYSKVFFASIPMVYTTHMTERELYGLVPDFLLPAAKLYLRLFLEHCTKILCCSTRNLAEMKEKGWGHKSLFIMDCVETGLFAPNAEAGKRFRKRHGIPPEKKVVACVASIQKRKGVFEFAQAARQHPGHQFVWVGQVPDFPMLQEREKLQALVKNPPENLLFTGLVKRELLPGPLNAADLFLFPSYSETFGVAIAEACCCGTPVLLRDVPEFEMFSDFASFFQGQKDLVEKVESILEDPRKLKEMRRKSLAARKNFEPEEHVKKILKIYEEAVKRK